jgi:hypothetical protein
MNLIHCTLHTDQRYFNDIDVVTGNKMGWLVQKCIHLHSPLDGTTKSETDAVIHQMKMALDEEATRHKEAIKDEKKRHRVNVEKINANYNESTASITLGNVIITILYLHRSGLQLFWAATSICDTKGTIDIPYSHRTCFTLLVLIGWHACIICAPKDMTLSQSVKPHGS